MKRPTAASLKKVTPENLARLGAERLAQMLIDMAEARPDLKRRLRMELAAEQGAEHLLPEVDKRLASLQGGETKVSWRKRPGFVSDLDDLRSLIAGRLAELDAPAALARLWAFLGLARRLERRVRDRDGTLQAVFERAADDLGRLLQGSDDPARAQRLVEAFAADGVRWAAWAPRIIPGLDPALLRDVLARMQAAGAATPGWTTIVRHLADATADAAAFRSTFTDLALATPSIAAEVARRFLQEGAVGEAGRLLEAARAAAAKSSGLLRARGREPEPDYDWESAWIDYLEAAGRADEAQSARWWSFERTLSAERVRAFTRRLKDFEDVEVEEKAMAHAAGHPDFARGLQFLMEWPALPAAARLIEARADDIHVGDEDAERWAARLQARYPAAAGLLLRKAAAAAFRRRDFATCDRLTQEADAIQPAD